ncbi:MAG TPA: hypothetical protein VK483_08215 [Chitinophagaceae bacterium]|nr:hypothetical protein [Chitinophagaceae bacterium]
MEKSKIIEKLFEHIVIYSYLILPLLFVITKTKKRDGMILAIYGLVFWLLLFFYYDIPKEFRKPVYQPIYTSLEYLFFASLFYFNMESLKFKKLIIGLSVLFIIFQGVYVIVFEKNRVDSISIGVESILIFVYIFLFFFENLTNLTSEIYIYSNHCFWISLGLLFYLGGSFFINILADSFTDEEWTKYWYLNYIADTVKTLFFAVAFIIYSSNSKKNIQSKSSSVPYLDMI